MTLDAIRVNHGALTTAAAQMQSTVRTIDARLERLETELAPLRDDWSGRAQQSYVVARAGWDRAIREMRDLLAETHLAVHRADEDYVDADRRGAALFGG